MSTSHVIRLESGQFGWDYVIRCGSKELLIQTDWDYPGVASAFGWIACTCGETDGTVDCSHKTASQMIQDAQKFLDGIADTDTTAIDPGYFLEES